MPRGNGATSTRAESAGNAQATFRLGIVCCLHSRLTVIHSAVDSIEIAQDISRRYSML